MIEVIKVVGRSMWPTFGCGDYVFLRTRWLKIAPGALVVVDHPEVGTIIKRIAVISADGETVKLSSDNLTTRSVTTQHWLKRQLIRGTVLFTIRRPGSKKT
jgi:SOS-response transcriptional repressor LexA